MKNSMSRILIETVVRNTLKNIKESPERSIRNLIDMALHVSEGRFQQNFFQTAQTMLQNENSPYYALVRDVVANVDTERLVNFGMNLGYNSCTIGAKQIRENESELGFNIPWAVAFDTDIQQSPEYLPEYHIAIEDGEKLGIYSWMLFPHSHPQKILPLISSHTDSAFFLFCCPDDIDTAFLDGISELHNLMLVIRYKEDIGELCSQIRRAGLLYSVYYPYSRKDIDAMSNGDLFYSIQQEHPVFTILQAQPGCPEAIVRLAHEITEQARREQSYQTIPWELYYDNRTIDKIISDDVCSPWFDANGDLCGWDKNVKRENCNLFENGLFSALKYAYPKKNRRK